MADISIMRIGDLTIPLRRSPKRRSIGIKVKAGAVTVAAPSVMSMTDIQLFVSQKLSWIKKHIAFQQQILPSKIRSSTALTAGAAIKFLGRELKIEVKPSAKMSGFMSADNICLEIPLGLQTPSRVRRLIQQIYSQEAFAYASKKIADYASVLGVMPAAIQIKEYKSRWGSCNRRRELQFNWLLMQAPQEAINYVIAHEICHLLHFNHSPAFWRQVERLMPDYKIWRQWFKSYGDALII